MGDVISGDEIRSLFSGIAIVVSVISFYFSRRSWLQSNRPIVTAFVSEYLSGSTLNLIISNTGNRPATNVRLIANENDISRLITATAQPERKKNIHACFQEAAVIPILRNGEELSTAFGAITSVHNESWMEHGAQIEIKVEYGDLDGHYYKSVMPLKIYARNGFAGNVWKASK